MSKIKVLAGLVSSEASLLGLHMAIFSLGLHMAFSSEHMSLASLCVLMPSFYKDTSCLIRAIT